MQKTKPLSDCICLSISSLSRCSADKSNSAAVTGLCGATAKVKPSPCVSLFERIRRKTPHTEFLPSFEFILHSKPVQNTETHTNSYFTFSLGFRNLDMVTGVSGEATRRNVKTLLVKTLRLVNKTGTNVHNKGCMINSTLIMISTPLVLLIIAILNSWINFTNCKILLKGKCYTASLCSFKRPKKHLCKPTNDDLC